MENPICDTIIRKAIKIIAPCTSNVAVITPSRPYPILRRTRIKSSFPTASTKVRKENLLICLKALK
jgi:hypothetical protein